MTQKNFWADIKKYVVEIALGLIVTALGTLLIASSGNFWKISQKEFKLDCENKVAVQNDVGFIEVSCKDDYYLTGGGIQNNFKQKIPESETEFKPKPETIFEESFPTDKNSWRCDTGVGNGSYTCFARCCKLK